MIVELEPLDNKIVLMGMSCVGKTTFAKQLKDHHYYCFDAMFHWRVIETFGLPVDDNLEEISKSCIAGKYVLDGWTLADSIGQFVPKDSRVYVIYAPYDQVIDQYRIPYSSRDEFRKMYSNWYGLNYKALEARYFRNEGLFVERGFDNFNQCVSLGRNQ